MAFFVIWTGFDYEPSKQLHTLVDEKKVVKKGGYYVFKPEANKEIKAGYIIYQGAKVEPLAYGYYTQQIANEGYLVAVVDSPFNMSFFSQNKATDIVKSYSKVPTWFIGGHSLGSVSTASYAYDHQKSIKGLVLLASYPMNKNNFSSSNYAILSLTGEKDGLSTPEKIKETKPLLSNNTEIVQVKGANHAQFGMYGKQKGDNKANISPKQQQDELVKRTVKWLNSQIEKIS
ncbi:alpha/beta hydrolase [Priestia aryabhattai]|uniref:alpha/beta hydrolase n=1 Tax=Priestia megaterium TaxID=1404 RepID=UPI0039B8E9C9